MTGGLRGPMREVPPAVQSAAWMAAVVLAGGVTWLAFSAWRAGDALRDRAQAVAALLDADATDAAEGADEVGGEPVAAVQRLGERNMFSPAPPQGFRRPQGVLGDRVLYPGGQSFAVGDNAMGATVKAIGLNHVELEFEGRALRVEFSSGGGGSPQRGRRGMRRGGRRR